MEFSIELVSITLAASSAYAILMFVLKREVAKKPVIVTTTTTIVFTALALVMSYRGFATIETGLPIGFLGLALVLGLALLGKLKKTSSPMDAVSVEIAKNIGMFLFTLLCANWLITIYFLAF